MIVPLLLAVQALTGVPEAEEAFASRQDHLVALAAKLGSLHRLSQLCDQDRYDVAIFRDHMKAVIDQERPVRDTRERMIGAFNQNFRATSSAHVYCSRGAEDEFRREALVALDLTERLSGPIQNR